MNEFGKIYILWLRDFRRYWREKPRIISSFALPLLWLGVFGTGMRTGNFADSVNKADDYRIFIFPGIIGMTLLFTGMWSGISVIWDREFGFFREIMVAPVSRISIVIGKALGGATSAIIQGTIILLCAPLLKIKLTCFSFLLSVPIMALTAIVIISIGLLIASLMESMEGFNLISSFIIMPMFFLSGALFSLKNSPQWLRNLSFINPLMYGVDALRTVILKGDYSILSIYLEISVLIIFATIFIFVSSYTFSLKK